MKKLWVYLLALAAAVLCLLPAPAHATDSEGYHDNHCICSTMPHQAIGDHTDDKEDKINWKEWPDDNHPMDGEYYYLKDSVELSDTLIITGDVTICLNGETLTCKSSPGIQIESGATLTITDCGPSGDIRIEGGSASYRHIVNKGTLNLYGGKLAGGNHTSGGVQNGEEGATGAIFNMYGGSISRCKSSSYGAVYNMSGCTFTMYDGGITNNEAPGGGVRNATGATFNMYGGTITGNTDSSSNAGGVWNSGDMHLKGNTIIRNNTGSDGRNNLVTENPITLDGALIQNAHIDLWVDTKDENAVILQGGKGHTITDGDIGRFSLEGSHSGKVLMLVYPSKTVKLLEPHVNHALCTGTHSDNAPGHSASCGTDVPFLPWDSADILPTDSGSYYLTQNVTLTSTAEIQASKQDDAVIICLNGKNISANGNFDTIEVTVTGRLNVTDCTSEGQITHLSKGGSYYTGVEVTVQGGTFEMYGGTITGTSDGKDTVSVGSTSNPGVFRMYGGMIRNRTAGGKGVHVANDAATFRMNCVIGSDPAIFAAGCAVHHEEGSTKLHSGYIKSESATTSAVLVESRTGIEAGTIKLDGSVRIDGGLEVKSSNAILVTDKFALVDDNKIQLTLGSGDPGDYFSRSQAWPQATLNSFASKDGKVFVQTDGTGNKNTGIRLLTPVTVPAAVTGLVYNGKEQVGVEKPESAIGVLIGSAIDADSYTATVKLKDGYVWQTGGGYTQDEQYVRWRIARKNPEASDFTVTGLGAYEYDGSAKAVTAALADRYPTQTDTLTWTVFYTKDGVTTANAPTGAGTYTVTLETAGNNNFNATAAPLALGTLTIGTASQNAPAGLKGVAPTTTNGTDGKITGVNGTMEYQVESDTVWRPCTGTEITGLTAGTHQVRYRADANHTASDAAAVVVPAHTHVWLGTWTDYDATCHAHPCANGDAWDTDSREPHVYANRNDDTCDVCGHRRSVTRIWTVSFLPGGGSGSMAAVDQHEGTAYILPACGFTAPDGKTFDRWSIDGTAYAVGDTYTITGDTVLTALWKNKTPNPTPVTPTGPVGPMKAGSFTSPKTFDAGVTVYAAAALLSLTGGTMCLRRKKRTSV